MGYGCRRTQYELSPAKRGRSGCRADWTMGARNDDHIQPASRLGLPRVAPGLRRLRGSAEGLRCNGGGGLPVRPGSQRSDRGHDFASISAVQAFIASPDLHEVMTKAGIEGEPTVWVTERIY